MTWMEEELSKAYEIKTQRLGIGPKLQLEGKVLNRILRATETGWEVEADPRHAELVIEQLGLGNEKALPPQDCQAQTKTTWRTTCRCKGKT